MIVGVYRGFKLRVERVVDGKYTRERSTAGDGEMMGGGGVEGGADVQVKKIGQYMPKMK